PSEGLAPLLAELIVKAMAPVPTVAGTLDLRAGTPVMAGDEAGLVLSDRGEIEVVRMMDNVGLRGPWSCGIGYRAAVWQSGRQIGFCLDEPFLLTEDRRVKSVNGHPRGAIRWSVLFGDGGRSALPIMPHDP
ncbi:MAG: hypothetical protein KKF33_10935, partial [Alphaproteobacteria bacterium]|nr:hypothetical protein [Alphaproteobacteria bacterium]